MSYIPTRISTGENGELNVLEKEEQNINITSAIMAFMSYAIKSSSIFVEHSNRKIITPDDIKRAMMVEVFMYFDREDLIIRTSEWRQIILEDMKNEYSEDEYEDNEDNEDNEIEEQEQLSKDKKSNVSCECGLCIQMNDIVDKWKYYEPKDELGKVFKKHIDLM
tara:strand:- start:831 stop:1322 length:492 start_codon:yes stop_codon:yes gene_type:complete